MGQAPGKCLSRTAQPYVKMPVRQKAAVQKAVVRGDGNIAPSWEELMARSAPKEVVFDDKAEPEVLNIALISLDLEEASVKLHGIKTGKKGWVKIRLMDHVQGSGQVKGAPQGLERRGHQRLVTGLEA